MADLLIRGLDDSTKEALKRRAIEHGCSQSAEARSILEHALEQERTGWVSELLSAAQSVGGFELELPSRHPARNFNFGEA